MSDPDNAAKKASAQSSDLASAWGMPVALAHCEQCDWGYMIPQGSNVEVCPHCFQGPLAPLEDLPDHLPHNLPPEMLEPFSAPPDTVDRGVQAFARRIPFCRLWKMRLRPMGAQFLKNMPNIPANRTRSGI